jgi:hypothetical protein
MKKLYFLLLLLTVTTLGVSQSSYNLEGTVLGTDEEPLLSATVVLLSQSDSTLVSFGLTDTKGRYKVMDVNQGAYILQVTYLGYAQHNNQLDIGDDFNPMMEPIQLESAQYALEEVEITADHVPIVVKKDTLEYNAAAFQTQPNEVVEDLLRQLPGVEVDSDGTITAQGEEVQSVTVDGKEFFGDDPTIATKNLPADAVEKVQIFDRRSEAAEFSGLDDGVREKSINLELKEDRRKGQFGTLEAGYGTDDRYKGRLSLNRFSTRTQISAIGNFNNVNEQGFSSADYVSFLQGIGFRNRGNGIALNNGLSNGFVTTNAGGLNINHDISDDVELTFSYFLNDISNKVRSFTTRETFGESLSFIDDEVNEELNNSTNHRLNAELEIEIDSSQDLTLRTNLVLNNGTSVFEGLSERSSNDGLLQNRSRQDYLNDGNSADLSGSAIYRKKFGKVKKRILTVQGSINDQTTDSDGDLISDNSFFDSGVESFVDNLVQLQTQSDDGLSYRLQTSFVEPLSTNTFLELRYERQNFNNKIRRVVEDIVAGTADFNEDLSNLYQRDYVYDRASLTWHLNTDNTSLSLEGAVQNSVLQGDILTEDLGVITSIENKVFRFLPRINLRHELGQSQNIRLRYSTSVNEPSIQQLQPVPDNSDPINVFAGNPDLIPEYSHTLRLNYVNFDQFSFRSFFAFINARYTLNNITNATVIDENFTQFTQPVNVDYDFNISGNLNFSTPLKLLRTRLNVGTRLSYNNSLVFINGIENIRNRWTPSVNARIENRSKKKIDWEIGGRYSFNVTNYNLSDRDQSFSNQSVFTDITYNIKQSFAINTGLDVNFYSEEQFGEATTVPVWKASVSKYLLKNQKLEIKLSVFDILNQNVGISRSNGLNFIENSEIISLGPYGLLSVIYAIRSNGQQAGAGGGRGGRGNVRVIR